MKLLQDKPGWVKFAIVGVIFLLFMALFCPFKAAAGDLSYAGPALKFEAAFSDTFSYGVPPGSTPSDLPNAYQFYAKDLSAFSVSREFDGAIETCPVDVPSGSSIMLPPGTPIMIGKRWSHVFYLNTTAATDSVVVLPFSG